MCLYFWRFEKYLCDINCDFYKCIGNGTNVAPVQLSNIHSYCCGHRFEKRIVSDNRKLNTSAKDSKSGSLAASEGRLKCGMVV